MLPLARLTVVTGANGTGKSSLYRALRFLADCGRGEVHPDLVRPLVSLIRAAASQTQVVVVTHSMAMLEFLNSVPVTDAEDDCDAVEIELYKELGETGVQGLGLLTIPPSDWGKR